MDEAFARAALLLGQEGMERLAQARVAVFGVGGVGGHVVEALARSGVGALDLIDNDQVCLSVICCMSVSTDDSSATDVQKMQDSMAARNKANLRTMAK